MQEIEFEKYKKQGPYHWEQAFHPIRGNAAAQARYNKCIRMLQDAIGGLAGKTVLDLGCGDGVLAYRLSRKGAVVYGLDVSKTGIRLAKQQLQTSKGTTVRLLVGSCYDTGFVDNHFDALVSSDVIEHVQDSERFLSEVRRILKPGAKAVISTPIRLKKDPLDSMHVREWFEEDFKQLINKHFPDSRFSVSHPVFWMELQNRIGLTKFIWNLLPGFMNPFLKNSKWRCFAMQYAVVSKKD